MTRAGQVGRTAMLGLLLAAAGCHNNSTTSSTAATSTTTRTTDTFSGTVAVGGDDFHTFSVSASGTVDVTLTAAALPASVVMTLSLGLPTADGRCSALTGASMKTAAGGTVQLSGVSSPSTLCVDVRDAGNQASPVAYSVTVTHP